MGFPTCLVFLAIAALVGVEGAEGADGGRIVPHLMDKLSTFTDWRMARSLAPRSAPPSRVKPAFVFMLQRGIEFPDPWVKFFSLADPRDFKLMVHISDYDTRVAKSQLPALFRGQVVAQRPTSWCHLTTTGQFSLADEAFEDAAVTHVIWLSGDSVPVKSLAYVRRQLAAQPEATTLCVDENHERAEMWNAVSRRHMQALVSMKGSLVKAFRQFDLMCEDEDMYYVPLKLMGFGRELRRQCIMWTDWVGGRSPGFRKPSSDRLEPDAGFLDSVAEKSHKSRALFEGGTHVLADTVGTKMHPWTFGTFPKEGLISIIDDPQIWFARKFVRKPKSAQGGVYDAFGNYVDGLSQFLLNIVDYSGRSLSLNGDADATTSQIVNPEHVLGSGGAPTSMPVAKDDSHFANIQGGAPANARLRATRAATIIAESSANSSDMLGGRAVAVANATMLHSHRRSARDTTRRQPSRRVSKRPPTSKPLKLKHTGKHRKSGKGGKSGKGHMHHDNKARQF